MEGIMEISAKNIANAVIIVNDFRERTGLDALKDLPRGIRRNPHHCILARAFNFKCRVTAGAYGWMVQFPGNEEKAKVLAEVLDRSVTSRGYSYTDDAQIYAVTLPKEIGDIALAFDRDELPNQYYQRFQS